MLLTGTKTHQVEPDITVFEISGRLNLGSLLQSVEYSVQTLINSGVRKLVIDVTGLTLIDSSGIGVLVSCGGLMDQLGGQVRVAGAQGSLAKVFEMVFTWTASFQSTRISPRRAGIFRAAPRLLDPLQIAVMRIVTAGK